MDLSLLKKESFKIFVDTSAVMHHSFPDYIRTIAANLKKEKTGIIISPDVYYELKGHLKNNYNNRIVKQATAGLDLLEWGLNENIMAPFEKHKNYADNSFLSLFTHYRVKYNLALITTDKRLTKEVLALNKSEAVDYIKSIQVYNLDKKGIPYQSVESHKNIDSILSMQVKPFKKSRSVVNESYFDPISLSSIPNEKNIVKSSNGNEYYLGKKIAQGGEGSIYEFKQSNKYAPSAVVPKQCYIKIYHESIIDQARVDKIKLIIGNKSLKIDGVCFPLAMIYNKENEPVGYVMKRASQNREVYDLQRSLMIRPELEKLFYGWKRHNLVAVCLNIVNTINAIHKYNILLGDINEQNILVDSNSQVYFIDTDSYQIENYPCPVGSATFTHPDILSKNYKTFLRKVEHERFAVATLIFKILLPGFSPYSYQGGSNPASNVKDRNFVFPFYNPSKKISHESSQLSDGIWKLIWDNLPNNIREAFYSTFALGEIREINDPLVDEEIDKVSNNKWDVKRGWINILSKYISELERGYHKNDLFPTSRKCKKNITVKKSTASSLFENRIELENLRQRSGTDIKIFQENKDGTIKDKPDIMILGLDEESVDLVISEIIELDEVVMDDRIVSFDNLFAQQVLSDNLLGKLSRLLAIGGRNSNLQRFKDQYLKGEGIIAKQHEKIILRRGIKTELELLSQNEIDFLEENKDKHMLKYLVIQGTTLTDFDSIERDLKLFFNKLYKKISIPQDINYKRFFGTGGVSLKNLLSDIGLRQNEIHIDTKKNISFIFSNKNEHINAINDALKKASETWKFKVEKRYSKHIISHIKSSHFKDAIDTKYNLYKDIDYQLEYHFDPIDKKRPFIELNTNDKSDQENILLEIQKCRKWKYSQIIPCPSANIDMIIGRHGKHINILREKSGLLSGFDGSIFFEEKITHITNIHISTRKKNDMEKLSRLIKKSIKILISGEKKKAIKNFRNKILDKK
jgi:tRNA A-37 threonylcarbamoyl transferase component Bud32